MGEEAIRVAVVHDWLVTKGGAERVLKEILSLFPNADIFTLVDFLSPKDRQEILRGKKTTTTFIQHLPFAKKHFRNYLPLFPKAMESLDLSGYDLIISSSWAFAKGVRTHKNQKHICYCHTPIRYAWDLYEEYTKNLPPIKKQIVKLALAYIRHWDRKSNNVDAFIANSRCVAKRIERVYGKESYLIHPPVDVEHFRPEKIEKEDFYLTLSRLVPYKKTKLIVEAFNQMPQKRLIVIGDGEELESIKNIAKSNITILGYQPDEVVKSYMQKAKAFVYAALEDFGIVMAEALAAGTPVIAYGECGASDIVCDNCGVKFFSQDVNAIIDAVKRLEERKFDYHALMDIALQFSRENFRGKFIKVVDEVL